jgi:hypothetical protein
MYLVGSTVEFNVVSLAKSVFSYDLLVSIEDFTAVTMKNGVFWDVTPCGYCKNRSFGGTWSPLLQGDKNR